MGERGGKPNARNRVRESAHLVRRSAAMRSVLLIGALSSSLSMCSYGYDSLPLEITAALGGESGVAGSASSPGNLGGTTSAEGGTLNSGTSGGVGPSSGGVPAVTGGNSGVGGGMNVGGALAAGGSSAGSSGGASAGGTGGGAMGAGGAATGGAATGGAATGGAATGGAATGGAATGGAATGGAATGGAATGGVATGGAATGGAATGGSGGASGLVGYWKLDEAVTTGIVADSSGFGNNGTYSATKPTVLTTVPAAIKFADPNCLKFNGSSAFVTIPNSSRYTGNATKSFTFSAWAFMSALPSNWKAVVAKEDITKYCGLWVNPFNEWTFEPNVTGGATAPAATGWHHVAAVQDATKNTRKIYVDGVLSGNTDTAVDCSSPAAFHLGSGDGSDDFWNGRIDDVRIYDTALTQADITNLAAGN